LLGPSFWLLGLTLTTLGRVQAPVVE
jgi:hypothetical protein